MADGRRAVGILRFTLHYFPFSCQLSSLVALELSLQYAVSNHISLFSGKMESKQLLVLAVWPYTQ